MLDKHILLFNVFETFQKHFCLSQAKNVCQALVCVVTKPANKTSNVCQTMFVRLAGALQAEGSAVLFQAEEGESRTHLARG